MSDQAVREVLESYLPGAAVLFLVKDGHRMVLAVTGPVDQLITEYEKAGLLVETPELKKAS